MKKDRWTEDEVLSLPSGELDYFDRKSGAILNETDFLKNLAKALSAFANSGGGHLVLGIKDDGTLDGVPKIHKGRTSTKDWLEQVIPGLLSYPLQDFRVHEIEPATPTTIPGGQVVIVIDVGDSQLAPHQSVKNHHYYYRAGGRSETAPHFFLELLWSRQNRYPGRKIARVWLDIMIAALTHLSYQQDNLARDRRGWDRLQRSDKLLVPLSDNPSVFSPNLEQMLEFYPDLAEPMDRHGKEVRAVWETMDNLYEALLEQRVSLEKAYEEIMSPDSRQQIFHAVSQKGGGSPSEGDLTRVLFGGFGLEHNLGILAQHIVSHSGELPDELMVAPLWNLRRETLMAILTRHPYCRLDDQVNFARLRLRHTVDELVASLKEKMRELAIKFNEPYVDTRAT